MPVTDVRSLTWMRIRIPAVRSCHSPAAAVVVAAAAAAAAVVAAAAADQNHQRSNPETTGHSSLLQENMPIIHHPSLIDTFIQIFMDYIPPDCP